MTVFDNDVVEDGNIAYQAYGLPDLGKPKAIALQEHADTIEPNAIQAETRKCTGVSTGILILAVDSMEERRKIAENSTFDIVIDGRMGGEYVSVFTYRDKNAYLASLYSDAEALPLECGAKATAYTGLLVAGLIARQATKFVMGADDLPREIHMPLSVLDFVCAT